MENIDMQSEVELELKAAAAEAAVMKETRQFRSAVGRLTEAIPNAAPVQAINTIGKLSAGVGTAVDQAEEIWTETLNTATPIVRLSKKAFAGVRANPAPFVIASVVGLIGLFLWGRNSRRLRQLR